MADLWPGLGGPPPLRNGGGDPETSGQGEGTLPPEAVEAWRTWLLTGKPGVVSDRRRVRGSHRGLKQMLVDGTGHDMPESWKHFSGAMVRLAINDALNALPKEQTHAVWLAYFGGLSNSEIARRLGVSPGSVERRLKRAFELVSEYVEHGRNAGRRVVFGLFGWFSLRRLLGLRPGGGSGTHPALTNAIVAAGATAVVLVGAAGSGQVQRPAAAPATVSRVAVAPGAVSSAASSDLNSATEPTMRSLQAAVRRVTEMVVHGPVAVPPVPSVPPVSPLPPVPSPQPLPSPPPIP